MIPLSKPEINDKELAAVAQVFDSGWLAGQGPAGEKLAKCFTHATGTKYAVPLVNCTAALHLAMIVIGIKPGDEVLVSDFTYPATAHAVLYCGATPVFVDVHLDTYTIDPKCVEAKITEKTKAVLINHAFGQTCDMEELKTICRKYQLILIEDAACAFGAMYKGKPAGSFGEIGVFSLHARKNVTSGEGGVLVTNSKAHFSLASSLACFGVESAHSRHNDFSIPVFKDLGYNYKLSDINAAIAVEQVKKYPNILKRRRKQMQWYHQKLLIHPHIKPPIEKEGNYHVYQTYSALLNPKINRDKLILDLRDDGIQTQIGTFACHIQPVYQSEDKCPNSLNLFNHSLALPLYHDLKKEKINFIIERLDYRISRQLG